MDYEKWKQLWRISSRGERLGQAFVNQFLPAGDQFTRTIFYVEDYWEADRLITDWLMNHHYYPNTPVVGE